MDDASVIRGSISPWCKAALERNWDALIAMCTSDVVFAPPGEPRVPANKLRPWLEAFPVMRKFDFSFDRLDISGDLAIGVGPGAWILEINGQTVSATFKFADVFKRGPQGTWRYAHVIWNLDAPGS
jgi:ketosteroid isomerase-like protein